MCWSCRGVLIRQWGISSDCRIALYSGAGGGEGVESGVKGHSARLEGKDVPQRPAAHETSLKQLGAARFLSLSLALAICSQQVLSAFNQTVKARTDRRSTVAWVKYSSHDVKITVLWLCL